MKKIAFFSSIILSITFLSGCAKQVTREDAINLLGEPIRIETLDAFSYTYESTVKTVKTLNGSAHETLIQTITSVAYSKKKNFFYCKRKHVNKDEINEKDDSFTDEHWGYVKNGEIYYVTKDEDGTSYYTQEFDEEYPNDVFRYYKSPFYVDYRQQITLTKLALGIETDDIYADYIDSVGGRIILSNLNATSTGKGKLEINSTFNLFDQKDIVSFSFESHQKYDNSLLKEGIIKQYVVQNNVRQKITGALIADTITYESEESIKKVKNTVTVKYPNISKAEKTR